MAVPTVIGDLDSVAANNSPAGSESVSTNMDNYLRAHAAFIAQLEAGKLDAAGVTAFAETLLDDADAAAARTTLGLAALATQATINNGDWSGDDLGVTNGGTGASTASAARTNLDVYSTSEVDSAVAAAGTGDAIRVSLTGSNQSISNNSWTKIQFNTVDIDTNSTYDNVTNYRFTPETPGYYAVSGGAQVATGTGRYILMVYKNGVAHTRITQLPLDGAYNYVGASTALVDMNGTTDYMELFLIQSSAGSLDLQASATDTFFTAYWVRGL